MKTTSKKATLKIKFKQVLKKLKQHHIGDTYAFWGTPVSANQAKAFTDTQPQSAKSAFLEFKTRINPHHFFDDFLGISRSNADMQTVKTHNNKKV